MRVRATEFLFLIAFLNMAALLTPGCQRTSWEEARNRRLERIHHHVERYVQHEEEGVERMDRTMAVAERSSCRHQDHLHRTAALVEREMQSDVQRWNEEIPKKRAYIRNQWDLREDRIPRTWAKMMY